MRSWQLPLNTRCRPSVCWLRKATELELHSNRASSGSVVTVPCLQGRHGTKHPWIPTVVRPKARSAAKADCIWSRAPWLFRFGGLRFGSLVGVYKQRIVHARSCKQSWCILQLRIFLGVCMRSLVLSQNFKASSRNEVSNIRCACVDHQRKLQPLHSSDPLLEQHGSESV